jgi:uncharacterized protein
VRRGGRRAVYGTGLTALTAIAALACAPAAGNQQDAAVADVDGTTAQGPAADGLVPVELATVGMDAAQHSPVVLLREQTSGKIVPIWVGVPEAHAILAVMLGIEMPRPMTHDLLTAVIKELGATVHEVLVHDVQGTTYIGRLRLRVGDESAIREIDSRPSDALAIAIRTDAPIRVAETLLADPPAFDFLAPEADEQVVRMLGVTVVAASGVLRTRYGLPDRPGLVVVGASGEAAERGLRRGDLIIEVQGSVPMEPMDFLNAVRAAGLTVQVRFWRDGEEREIELSPARVPEEERRRRGPSPIQT